MGTWDIFYKNILCNSLVTHSDKIVLSISGGMDSMCMLHLFWRLKKKIDVNLLVVNFNHNIREDSKLEMKIVKSFADKLKISCIFKEIEVEKYSQKKSISIETSGRVLRYSFLKKIAKQNNSNVIATAHNSNDNAETVFMWLLRGSGNFIGIPMVRQLRKNLTLIRPLLPVNRNLIEEYIEKQKIPFCVDKSNFKDIYTRNKIRLSLIPICKDINPMVIEHIFTLSCIRAREDEYLETIIDEHLKQCVKTLGNKILLDLPMFLRYNKAVMFRILKRILPKKKYNYHIDLIMRKIMLTDMSIYRFSSDWIFKIESSNMACFVHEKKT
ncbi:MAG: tRNA lysidine(34) synthetase TilS [Endomicrobium sp.]|jgi:tRNA(Ile)-lysidine synthase|nr:tRNA lysidine(34) synthetase TilS [Endomicrobium sp.]